MRHLLHVIALSVVLFIASAVSAFKPAPPAKRIVYRDTSKKKVRFVLETNGWRPTSARVIGLKKTWHWKKAPAIPATVVVDAASRRVVLLGGYGDGCAALGTIAVYDFTGKMLASFDLKTTIKTLDKLSRAYTRICCPCRWIHGTRVKSGKLEINVCDKKRAIVTLKKPALRIP